MEYKDLFPNKKINTTNDYENMILEQRERLREKHDMTTADLVNMLFVERRNVEAQRKLIVSLECELKDLEEDYKTLEESYEKLSNEYLVLEDQFIRIGGAEDPAMRG